MAWLLPLLLLAIVGGAIFWMMDRDGRETGDDAATVGTTGRSESALGALEPGSSVNLARATVTEVVGDRTFWVGEGSERALVVIPEDSSGAASRETRQQFERGQHVAITGRVAADGSAAEGLKEDDRDAVRSAEGRVILARSVKQVEAR